MRSRKRVWNAEFGMRSTEYRVLCTFHSARHISPSVLRTLHSALRIPPSAFRIPNSAFRIRNSAFRIPNFAFSPRLQRAVPATVVHIHAADLHAVLSGVAHELRRGVEAHRLAVEHGRRERG